MFGGVSINIAERFSGLRWRLPSIAPVRWLFAYRNSAARRTLPCAGRDPRSKPLRLWKSCTCGSWRTGDWKSIKYPRRHSGKERNLLPHGELMLEKVSLILFGPAFAGIPVTTERSAATEFADDEWLIVWRFPMRVVGGVDRAFVPADVFVHAEHVDDWRRGDHRSGACCRLDAW